MSKQRPAQFLQCRRPSYPSVWAHNPQAKEQRHVRPLPPLLRGLLRGVCGWGGSLSLSRPETPDPPFHQLWRRGERMFGRRKRGIPKICIRAWLRMVGVFSRPLFSPPWIGREAPCMYPVLSPPSPQNGKGEWASDGALGSPSPPSPVRLLGKGLLPMASLFHCDGGGEPGGALENLRPPRPIPHFFS